MEQKIEPNKWYVIELRLITEIKGLQKCHCNRYKEVYFNKASTWRDCSGLYKFLIHGDEVQDRVNHIIANFKAKIDNLWIESSNKYATSFYHRDDLVKPTFYKRPEECISIDYMHIFEAENISYAQLQEIATVEQFEKFHKFILNKLKSKNK